MLNDTVVPLERRSAAAGWLEWIVVFLLPLGGFVVPVLGWLVGAGLLWCSRVWTTREKLIGTLVVPGGLGSLPLVALLASTQGACSGGGFSGHIVSHCTSTSPDLPNVLSIPLLALFAAGAIATPVFLARRAKTRRAS